MRRSTKRVVAEAAGLGAVAGLRSITAPALLIWAANRGRLRLHRRPLRFLGRRRALKVASGLAMGEIVADKMPFVPDRTILPSLAGRIASGALVGAAICISRRKPVIAGVVAGGLGALAGTYIGFRLRRQLSERVSDKLVAVAEDAVAVGGGALLMRAA